MPPKTPKPDKPDEKPKKQLRTSLTAFEYFFMLLMPVSQLTLWTLLTMCYLDGSVYQVLDYLRAIAWFYALWAMKIRFLENAREKGHYAFFMIIIGNVSTEETIQIPYGFMLSLLGVLSVLAAFGLSAKSVLMWAPSKLAYVAKKTRNWALVMKFYWASSMCWWSVILVLLLRKQLTI